MKLGFYGEFPESWNLTPEQKQAMYALEDAIIKAAETTEVSVDAEETIETAQCGEDR